MSIKSKTIIDKIKRNNPYFEDFITRSIYNSNAIEGNTLSYAETYAIVFNDNSIKVNTTARELYEAINLKYAISGVMASVDTDLSLDYIKRIGIQINKNISEISGFRKNRVFIRGAEHIPPEGFDIPRLLSQLIYKDKKLVGECVLDYVARFHIAFERIHPFSDGNGRTGRVLITKELLSRGLAPLVIPLDYRNSYMGLLASCNIKEMSRMFKELQDLEIGRMRQFNIQ